jgi:hypothetical protein
LFNIKLAEKIAIMKPLLTAILVLGITFTVSSQTNWIQTPNKNENIKLFLHTERTTINGDIISTWGKIVYSGEKLTSEKNHLTSTFKKDFSNFSYQKLQIDFNCKTQKNSISQVIYYDTEDVYIFSYSHETANWTYVVPDSFIERMYILACNFFTK